MPEINKSKVAYVLWSLLSGTLSFFVSGVIACIIVLRLNTYILETIIAGGIAGLLLGVLLGKFKMIGKIVLAGLIAVPFGFWGSFALAGGMDFLITLTGVNTENPDIAGFSNIIGIIFMGTLCGATFGAIIYGRKSIPQFSIICGAVSIPFALLVGAMNSGHWIKAWLENLFHVFGSIDMNLLAIITEFGVGIGLSVGLYGMINQKKGDRSF